MAVTLTQVAHDDDAGLAELLAFTAEHGTPRATEPEAYRELMARTDAWRCVGARVDDGGLAAVALASVVSAVGADQVQLNAFLAPGRDDAFAAVLADIEAWGAARGAVAVTAHVSEPSDADLAAWERAGFELVGERSRVARAVTDADRDLPSAAPEGIELVSLSQHPELEADAELLWQSGHDDIPSALRFDSGDLPTLREELGLGAGEPMPGLVLVALAAGQVVGIALLLRSEAEPESAGHRFTTVDRTWRGRGVARALKVELIRLAARDGITRLQASNDDGNAPMRAINDALGYAVQYRIVLLRRMIRS